MKSTNTSLASLVLTLFMLLLVLLSLFWFLYRGWGPLTEQAQQADLRATRIATLEGELRQNSDALLTAQSTRDALQIELAGAIEAHQIAEAETIAEQVAKNLLATRTAELSAELETAQQTTYPPLTAVTQPLHGAILPNNETVELVVVAADHAGLESLSVSGILAGETQALSGETTYTWRLFWPPLEVGEYTVVITAVNSAQLTSQPISVTFQIVEQSIGPQSIEE